MYLILKLKCFCSHLSLVVNLQTPINTATETNQHKICNKKNKTKQNRVKESICIKLKLCRSSSLVC